MKYRLILAARLAIQYFSSFIHIFIPNGKIPNFPKMIVIELFKRIVFDADSNVVFVKYGPLKGFKKFGPFRSSDIDFALGQYEPKVCEVMEKIVLANMTVFDVGANAGYLTLLFSKLVGEDGRVYAFEPIPETCVCLEKTLNINDIKNVFVVRSAISDSEDLATMYYREALDGCASMMSASQGYYQNDENCKSLKAVDVNTITLDRFFIENDIQGVDIIKIDIEGAEIRALSGMKKVLLDYHPALVIELWGDQNSADAIQILNSFTYNIKEINLWKGYVNGKLATIRTIFAT